MTHNQANQSPIRVYNVQIRPKIVRQIGSASHIARIDVNVRPYGSTAAEQHLRMARVRAVTPCCAVTKQRITRPSIRMVGRYVDTARCARRFDLPYDFRTDLTLYTRMGDWSLGCASLFRFILVGKTFIKSQRISTSEE